MKPPSEAHGLLCHYFHGPGFPAAQGSLSVDDFERLLDAYGNRLIRANNWLSYQQTGELEDAVCITFDDGLYEAHALALPVLEARGLTACWNVYTGPYVGVPNNMELYRWVRNHGFGGIEGFYAEWKEAVDKFWWTYSFYSGPERAYLTQDDKFFRQWRDDVGPATYEETMDKMVIMAMAAGLPPKQSWMTPRQIQNLEYTGHAIGIHTHSHPTDITQLSYEQQALEYATAKFILTDSFGLRITTASHPRGMASPYGIRWLRENGFTMAWGATMEGEGPWMTPRWSTGNFRL